MVAKVIHEGSNRQKHPFICMNCAAIPDTLLESELFGYNSGAFTGAVGVKQGKFELAHKGTMLFDEIGDMSLPAQAKLLRAIEERQILRLGGKERIPVDVRIIAATNQNLRSAHVRREHSEMISTIDSMLREFTCLRCETARKTFLCCFSIMFRNSTRNLTERLKDSAKKRWTSYCSTRGQEISEN